MLWNAVFAVSRVNFCHKPVCIRKVARQVKRCSYSNGGTPRQEVRNGLTQINPKGLTIS